LPAFAYPVGNLRSNTRNQFPCIPAAISFALYPRLRNKSGILWTSAKVSKSFGVSSVP
jgi:hypothetical protein